MIYSHSQLFKGYELSLKNQFEFANNFLKIIVQYKCFVLLKCTEMVRKKYN